MASDRLLKKLYYDPSHPGSFGGVERLRRAAQEETGKKIKSEEILDFLADQDSYTLHKPARVRFGRNRVFVTKPMKQFQADLCDTQALAEHNDG